MAVNRIYDAIVVGAGPAGSAAARSLASYGFKVLLLDKSDFPRNKTCGGGVIGATAKFLPRGLVPKNTITTASFSLRGGKRWSQTVAEPLLRTVEQHDSRLASARLASVCFA